ncbi:hypothetical protein PVT01_030006800 [Plasmodium vivax]|uniref:Plasmodium RESA N-terminal domain-containing protein n=1 Tax=Plasmodium vivax TaxID=5855 RepID=A0A1G4GRP9_PLAVI|nr:hypothetical protein PVT01_030006800 [Plasmodium vivax]
MDRLDHKHFFYYMEKLIPYDTVSYIIFMNNKTKAWSDLIKRNRDKWRNYLSDAIRNYRLGKHGMTTDKERKTPFDEWKLGSKLGSKFSLADSRSKLGYRMSLDDSISKLGSRFSPDDSVSEWGSKFSLADSRSEFGSNFSLDDSRSEEGS